jgi:hypothetical protein
MLVCGIPSATTIPRSSRSTSPSAISEFGVARAVVAQRSMATLKMVRNATQWITTDRNSAGSSGASVR